MKLILFEGVDGWRWRIQARNGEILATSEAYSSRAKAVKTAVRVSGCSSWQLVEPKPKPQRGA